MLRAALATVTGQPSTRRLFIPLLLNISRTSLGKGQKQVLARECANRNPPFFPMDQPVVRKHWLELALEAAGGAGFRQRHVESGEAGDLDHQSVDNTQFVQIQADLVGVELVAGVGQVLGAERIGPLRH